MNKGKLEPRAKKFIAQEMGEEGEPKNYSEAIFSDDSTKWIAAMQEEVKSLLKNETWELVKLP